MTLEGRFHDFKITQDEHEMAAAKENREKRRSRKPFDRTASVIEQSKKWKKAKTKNSNQPTNGGIKNRVIELYSCHISSTMLLLLLKDGWVCCWLTTFPNDWDYSFAFVARPLVTPLFPIRHRSWANNPEWTKHTTFEYLMKPHCSLNII